MKGCDFMTKWNIKDVLLVIVFNVVLILFSQLVLLITQNIPMNMIVAELIICGMPIIFSIPFTYMLKSKGKKLWVVEMILAIFIVILLIYGRKPSLFNFLSFNSETFGFGVLYTIIHCVGLFVGSTIGYLIWYFKKKLCKSK